MKTHKKSVTPVASAIEASAQTAGTVLVRPIRSAYASFRIRGTTPLLCDKPPPEAEGKQSKTTNPAVLLKQKIYTDEQGRTALPALAFKKAMLNAAGYVGKFKTKLLGTLFVVGDWVLLENIPVPTLAFHTTRNEKQQIVPTQRACFAPGWEATLTLEYDPTVVKEQQLTDTLVRAGHSIGVGVWRPSSKSGGRYGRFEVIGAGLMPATT